MWILTGMWYSAVRLEAYEDAHGWSLLGVQCKATSSQSMSSRESWMVTRAKLSLNLLTGQIALARIVYRCFSLLRWSLYTCLINISLLRYTFQQQGDHPSPTKSPPNALTFLNATSSMSSYKARRIWPGSSSLQNQPATTACKKRNWPNGCMAVE